MAPIVMIKHLLNQSTAILNLVFKGIILTVPLHQNNLPPII